MRPNEREPGRRVGLLSEGEFPVAVRFSKEVTAESAAVPVRIDPEVDVPASLMGREVAPVVVEQAPHLSGLVAPAEAVGGSAGVVPKNVVAESCRAQAGMLACHHRPVVGHHAVVDGRDQGDFRAVHHGRDGANTSGRRNRRTDPEGPVNPATGTGESSATSAPSRVGELRSPTRPLRQIRTFAWAALGHTGLVAVMSRPATSNAFASQ